MGMGEGIANLCVCKWAEEGISADGLARGSWMEGDSRERARGAEWERVRAEAVPPSIWTVASLQSRMRASVKCKRWVAGGGGAD